MALEVATWRRRRDNPNLTVVEASRPEHGSVIDRWLADWQAVEKRGCDSAEARAIEFTEAQYRAAVRAHEIHAAYMAAIAAKRVRSSSEFSGPGGYDGIDPWREDIEKRDRAAKAAYNEMRSTLLEAGSLCNFAFETIVLENVYAEKLRGDLRLGMNSLARLWRIEG